MSSSSLFVDKYHMSSFRNKWNQVLQTKDCGKIFLLKSFQNTKNSILGGVSEKSWCLNSPWWKATSLTSLIFLILLVFMEYY